jgi:dolichol-phosphate mannosyltransferase
MKDIVIVPVFNEIDTVDRTIAAILHYAGDADVLVVDDGSSDGSSECIDQIEGITVLHHRENSGYGASLISGFTYALERGYDRAVTIDCDEQHEPALIPTMFATLTGRGVDILSGSRYLEESSHDDAPPVERRQVNIAVTALIEQITRYHLTDAFCGFKAYQVAALRHLQLTDSGYAMPLQLWIQAFHFRLTVAEIPSPRIYKNLNRSFGGQLDDAEQRLAYYQRVIEKERDRWPISSSSELTQTI